MNKKLFLPLLAFSCLTATHAQSDGIERGATEMPYVRYEADAGSYGGGARLYENPEFLQELIAAEASDQTYVGLPSNGSFASFTMNGSANGVTLRFTLPDAAGGEGVEGSLDMFVNDNFVQTIDLTSYWAWQYFPSERPEDTPGPKPRMRFDEVHFLLDDAVSAGDVIKFQKTNGDSFEYGIDFIETEQVGAPLSQPAGFVSVTDFGAVANDGVDDLPAFQDALVAAGSRGTGVYVPAGTWTLDNKLLFETSNIAMQGAGIWYTNLFFSREERFTGGILARCSNVEISHLYLNTINNQRFLNGDYVITKGFMGTYGDNSKIHDTWVTHFEVGAWIAGYDAPYPIDITQRLEFYNNRIRNNYADGINLAQGTSNSTVSQNNFRSNGDDAMAVWTSNAFQATVGVNNEFKFNTVENTYRAGGAAIFGGTGHSVHHCIIKDGMASSGLRVTSDFPGFQFENNEAIRFYENTLIAVGTSEDLFRKERGAIEINATNGPVTNIFFENIDIIDAQRHGIQIGSTNNTELFFDNISINGTGLDPVVDSEYTGPLLGAAVMVHARAGTSIFNNLVMENIELDPPIYIVPGGYELIINNGTIPLTGISLGDQDVVLANGESQSVTVTFSPSNASNKKLSWSSSNEDVAIFNEANGEIEATGVGSATLTATSEEGDFSASIEVRVEAVVTLEASGQPAESGETGMFTFAIPELSGSVDVLYEISGSAQRSDYSSAPTLSGSITLSANNLSSAVTISATDDDDFEGSETLQITLLPGKGYRLGNTPPTATLTILDNETAPCESPAIAETSVQPNIDQTIEAAWSIAPSKEIANATIGNAPSDFSGRWKALYDANALYVLVEVSDATLTNDSGAAWWNDDTIEIFIDSDNSKGSSYDGLNDFQLGFRWDDATVNTGGNSVKNTSGINFSLYQTANGYNLEAAIPWSTIGINPVQGDQIGFDIAVDDDDNGGQRDSQTASIASTDAGWANPSLFGSVFLTSCDSGGGGPVNRSPVVNAGQDQSVLSDVASVVLTGTASDPDGDTLTYIWSQTAGPAVTIASPSSIRSTISGLSAGATYTFALTASDGSLSVTDSVTVSVGNEDNTGNNTGEGFTIQNVWSNDYLRDGGATVSYGATPDSDEYLWVVEEATGNRVEIRNVATGDYMHIENLTGSVECSTRQPIWASSKWVVSQTDEGSARIENVWQSGQFVHVENLTGVAQIGPIFPVWGSAKWLIRAASPEQANIAESIRLYPNPAQSRMQVAFEGSDALVSVLDLAGRQLIAPRNLRSGELLSVASLPKGVYVVVIEQNGIKSTKQLIKE